MKKSIVYYCTNPSSFVKRDIDILKEEFDVRLFVFKPSHIIYTPFYLIYQFFHILWYSFSSSMFICMFGGYHSFWPSLIGRLFGKPCIIIVGGTDCVSFPSIGYGNFRKNPLRWVTRMSYENCTHIVPVHKSLVYYPYTYSSDDYEFQGYKYFCPNVNTPFTEIGYGFDPDEWPTGPNRINNSFITVAAGLGKPYRAVLKGVDLIVSAAKKYPEMNFTIIGYPENYIKPKELKNVNCYSFVPNNELKNLFSKHEFYLQVSMSEGFPNAICEAMLCGCIPIGSNVGGIQSIIDNTGFILNTKSEESFFKLISEAVNCNKEMYSGMARKRMLTVYPKDYRKEKILNLVHQLLYK